MPNSHAHGILRQVRSILVAPGGFPPPPGLPQIPDSLPQAPPHLYPLVFPLLVLLPLILSFSSMLSVSE
jgi:hypothetical protein